MTPCLFETPLFQQGVHPFLGLKLQNEVEKDTSFLKCCGGSGCRFSETGSVNRCDLDKRLFYTKDIFDAFRSAYNTNLKTSLSLEQKEFLKGWLSNPTKGYMMSHPSLGPSQLWEIAAMMAWQGGIKTKVLSSSHFKDTDLYATDRDWDVLFLEGVDRLWLPERALEFSLVIDFAFAHALPLWVSMAQGPKSKGEGLASPSRTVRKYNRKISELKQSRSPLEWLSESTLGKLQDQCEGWQAFL